MEKNEKSWGGYKQKNIYIVDDDESICQGLKSLLITYGFKVKTFNSAKSFFDTVSNNTSGCVVLDINMPEVNGWVVLKRIVKSGWSLPVIIISAGHENTIKDALQAGAVGFCKNLLMVRSW